MAKRRSFICATPDLERFEQRVIALSESQASFEDDKVKTLTVIETCYKILNHYSNLLLNYGVKPDRFTKRAAEEFLDHCTILNVHLFAHHVVWQLLESYKAHNPKMFLLDQEIVESWRKATEDCIQE